MQWHLSRAWAEPELRRRGEEEIWAEGPVWSDEWGAHGYEEQWKAVHAGYCRGSEREISRNVGNEVRPSDLVIHEENFQWHCKWEMTGEVCGAGLCRQGLMECLSEEVRGSWVRRQVTRRAGGVFQEGVFQPVHSPHAGKSLKHGRDGKAGEAAVGGRGRQTWRHRARRNYPMQLVY